jgi:hypothetical protein
LEIYNFILMKLDLIIEQLGNGFIGSFLIIHHGQLIADIYLSFLT